MRLLQIKNRYDDFSHERRAYRQPVDLKSRSFYSVNGIYLQRSRLLADDSLVMDGEGIYVKEPLRGKLAKDRDLLDYIFKEHGRAYNRYITSEAGWVTFFVPNSLFVGMWKKLGLINLFDSNIVYMRNVYFGTYASLAPTYEKTLERGERGVFVSTRIDGRAEVINVLYDRKEEKKLAMRAHVWIEGGFLWAQPMYSSVREVDDVDIVLPESI